MSRWARPVRLVLEPPWDDLADLKKQLRELGVALSEWKGEVTLNEEGEKMSYHHEFRCKPDDLEDQIMKVQQNPMVPINVAAALWALVSGVAVEAKERRAVVYVKCIGHGGKRGAIGGRADLEVRMEPLAGSSS